MGRKMPVKTRRIELEGDYKDWWVDVRINPPVGLLFDSIAIFESANKENIKEVLPPIYDILGLVIHQWNFVDEKGKDLPATKEGTKKLSIDILMLLTTKVIEVILEVPLAPSTS